jgi:hypothetical protein
MATGRKRIPDQVRDDEGAGEVPAWVTAFLAGLIVNWSVLLALREADVDFETAWALRSAEPEFAMYWDRALRVHRAIMADVLDTAECDEASVH